MGDHREEGGLDHGGDSDQAAALQMTSKGFISRIVPVADQVCIGFTHNQHVRAEFGDDCLYLTDLVCWRFRFTWNILMKEGNLTLEIVTIVSSHSLVS